MNIVDENSGVVLRRNGPGEPRMGAGAMSVGADSGYDTLTSTGRSGFHARRRLGTFAVRLLMERDG